LRTLGGEADALVGLLAVQAVQARHARNMILQAEVPDQLESMIVHNQIRGKLRN